MVGLVGPRIMVYWSLNAKNAWVTTSIGSTSTVFVHGRDRRSLRACRLASVSR